MGGVAASGRRPRGEDLVIHRMRRVVGGRLVGVTVAQIDVGQVLEANQRPIAGRCVDIEGSLQRRHHQSIKIGNPPGLDHRHVGQLGERCRRRCVTRNDKKRSPARCR